MFAQIAKSSPSQKYCSLPEQGAVCYCLRIVQQLRPKDLISGRSRAQLNPETRE